MSDERSSLREVRGAVIICDHHEVTASGKHIIVGTYNRVHVSGPSYVGRLTLYLRAQVESAGDHRLIVRVLRRDQVANAPALAQAELNVHVTDPNEPMEIGIATPPIRVDCPTPFESLGPGEAATVALGVEAELAGSPLSTSKLTVIFAH